jgi:hypothetical protein
VSCNNGRGVPRNFKDTLMGPLWGGSSQTGVAVVDKRDGADLVRGWEGIGGRSGDAFPGL